ncbi:MAG: hypothetical protein HYR91_02055 [Flavobacteriia bacterium]|nr:hypothetical protein [Flavobacteriia bacterium]
MKAKFVKKIFHLVMVCISVLSVAFSYSKYEKKELSLEEAIRDKWINVNYIHAAKFSNLEMVVFNKTRYYIHLKLPKNSIVKLVGKRKLFFKISMNEFIDLCPHANVDQEIIGKCFQKN